ncbi:MAG: malate dehydrogenase [Gammaproteobacteria bacterium]|nr:malate dehydrogenase [Gammaproteobacteria bacterium]
MNHKKAKVVVTGAGGNIGYSFLFRLASGHGLGPDVELDLVLLERESALPSLKGVVMELSDCAFPLLKKLTCTSDVKLAMQDANWAILIGAVPRKAGMERSDLLKINGSIFTEQGKAINEYAAENIRVLVVGNPCNTNCYIAMQNAPKIPKNRFFALTMLDELRAKCQLAARAGTDVTSVSNMAIWGNHSATQYPDFYHAKIKGRKILEVIGDENWLQTEFLKKVQQRGTEIIQARGASSAASAAHAVLETLQRLTSLTPQDDWFSVCICSEGQYGVDPGLIFSYPCRIEKDGLYVVKGIEHAVFAQGKIQATLAELRGERDAVRQLGLVR